MNSSGEIQYINSRLFEDNGYKTNELLILLGIGQYNNAYNKARWKYTGFDNITDTAKNSWMRAPGKLNIY